MQMVAYLACIAAGAKITAIERENMDSRNKRMKNIMGNIFKISNLAHSISSATMEGLTVKQWLVILSLVSEPQKWHTLNEVAEKVGVTRQSMKKMVNTLSEKSYIEITPSETDKRAYQIKITKKAIRHFENNKNDFVKILINIFEGFDDEELVQFNHALVKMKDNIRNEILE